MPVLSRVVRGGWEIEMATVLPTRPATARSVKCEVGRLLDSLSVSDIFRRRLLIGREK